MADKTLVGAIAGGAGLLGGFLIGDAIAAPKLPVFIGSDWENAENLLRNHGFNPVRYSTPVFGEGMPMLKPPIILLVPASDAGDATQLLRDWKTGQPLPQPEGSRLM